MAAPFSDYRWKSPLLIQLFVTWVTSSEGEEQISNLIWETLTRVPEKNGTFPQNPSLSLNRSEKDEGNLLASPPFLLNSSKGGAGGETGIGGTLIKPSEGSKLSKGAVGIKTTQFVVSPVREPAPPPSNQINRLPRLIAPTNYAESGSPGDSQQMASFPIHASFEDIPPFYSRNLSQGILPSPSEKEISELDQLLCRDEVSDAIVTRDDFSILAEKVFRIPLWMKDLLFDRIAQRTAEKGFSSSAADQLTSEQVSFFFRNSFANLAQSRRFFEIIKDDLSRNYITLEDLIEMVLYLVAAHSSLQFVTQSEYKEAYAQTVAIRIMYALEHQQAKKIFWQDFNRSSLPDVLQEVDTKDVNEVLEYFSYQHYYVLYCKFWELDTDRDMHLNYYDMCNYGQGMLTPLVIRRVVDGYGRALSSGVKDILDYEDFVYFCLSEEDKNSQAAVYYWFKILDLDGDGVLSGHELATFFASENQQRLSECFGFVDPPLYEDMMCQMLDMLGVDPQRLKKHHGGLTLADFRSCPTPANFFNMVFNASKFFSFECRDPFLELHNKQGPERTDWDRFALLEYSRMSAEAR